MVTTVKIRDSRPSALTSVCPLALTATHANAVGRPSVQKQPQRYLVPALSVQGLKGLAVGTGTTSTASTSCKINYMGIAIAMGEGTAASLRSGVQRVFALGHKAKGDEARGIPPRGRPV